MTAGDRVIRLHQDPHLFREAVTFTAAQTRFAPRLIEKDYFCSLILQHLAVAAPNLLFRGGTCLAKVYFGFYRLSEDLDFLVPTPVEATRAQRSRRAAESREAVSLVANHSPGLRVLRPLTGVNECRQYVARFAYRSLLADQQETIDIEVSLREPLLLAGDRNEARTLLLDPVSGSAAAPRFVVPCLSQTEAMAEKLRAALSRREVAIRDFYDIDYAVRRQGYRLDDPLLVELVKRKLAIPGNQPADVSPGRLTALRAQLDSQLKPVLREQDFAEFDLDEAFARVAQFAGVIL